MVLTSNNIHSLNNLLTLTIKYCKKYHVDLCSDKTKLQVFHPPSLWLDAEYTKIINPISVDGKTIPFVEEVEHVGILRSSKGNLPNLLNRIASHKKGNGFSIVLWNSTEPQRKPSSLYQN